MKFNKNCDFLKLTFCGSGDRSAYSPCCPGNVATAHYLLLGPTSRVISSYAFWEGTGIFDFECETKIINAMSPFLVG